LLWRLQERMKEESDVRALIFNLLWSLKDDGNGGGD
jgi:hypothetical protein